MKKQFELEEKLRMFKTRRSAVVFLVLLASFVCGKSWAQGNPDIKAVDTLTRSATFEVVSIHPEKPSPDGKVRMQVGFTPNGTFTAHGITLKRLISMAYDLDEMQVTGGPDWLDQDRFSVEAKSDSATQERLKILSGPEQKAVAQQMVKALMADRFNLTLRPGTKEVPILALVVAKNGLKIKEATPGDSYANGLKDQNGQGHAGMMRFDGGSVTAQGVPLDNLTRLLTEQLHQIVENKTGLTEKYDFKLEWSRDEDHDGRPGPNADAGGANGADASAPPIFTALQEQMGLKLESQKGAVPAFAVERADRPTDN